jgi:hypothetical protein
MFQYPAVFGLAASGETSWFGRRRRARDFQREDDVTLVTVFRLDSAVLRSDGGILHVFH